VLLQQVVVTLISRGPAPHFGFLAQAFLHGRLDIPLPLLDASIYHGRYFVPMGPFPAVLFLPLVALLGPYLPVLVLCLLVFAVTMPVVWRLWVALGVDDRGVRGWLTLGTLGGTAYFTNLVANGSSNSAHIVSFALLSGALLFAVRDRAPLVAGLLLGCAVATRETEILALPGLALVYALNHRSAGARAAVVGQLGLGLVPPLLLIAVYNAARFGSPLESGYAFQRMYLIPNMEGVRTGLFSLAHVPKNLYYALIASPVPVGGEDTAVLRFPWIRPSLWGMGVIFVSPWLLLGLAARGRLALSLAAGAAPVIAADLLWWSTGYFQFGYRFLLDALPFLVALVALAVRRPAAAAWLPRLVAISLLVNAWGAQF
jgi:hypothetical protein